MYVCKGPEKTKNLVCSRKKCGQSKVYDGQVEEDAVGKMGAWKMCQICNAMVRNFDLIRIAVGRQWRVCIRDAAYLCH